MLLTVPPEITAEEDLLIIGDVQSLLPLLREAVW
jgi:hypothetical protein